MKVEEKKKELEKEKEVYRLSESQRQKILSQVPLYLKKYSKT